MTDRLDQPAPVDPAVRATWTAGGAHDAHLPEHAVRWLTERTGLVARDTPVAPESALTVPESALSEQAKAAFAEIVGAEHVRVDRDARLGRSGGLSYLDLLARRGSGETSVPDAVVEPADPEQVQRIVTACVEHRVGVVPFGGGTSVVGGVRALRGGNDAVIVLDLARLNRLVSVDRESGTAVLQAGVVAPEAERLLAEHGLTLGHFPQSFERATIGGFAATRSSGQASAGYGRFEDMVEGVRLATPRGDWRVGVSPASAAGPDLRQLVVGSEGAFGVITEVTLRVRALPTHVRYEGFVLDGWTAGVRAVRLLAKADALGHVTRLSDPEETEVGLTLSGGWKTTLVRKYLRARKITTPCLLIIGWEGRSARDLAVRRSATLRLLSTTGAVRLGTPAGSAWRRGRFGGPRQRDALMDVGICVETLETATYWSTVDSLRSSVREALLDTLTEPGRRPIVACHISHSYETGASLYFTAIVPRDHDDPVGQWRRAKAGACAAISTDHLGTITHHHAVGVDHAGYLAAEIGDIGVEVLAAVKRQLDPTGVLNPAKLIASADEPPRGTATR